MHTQYNRKFELPILVCDRHGIILQSLFHEVYEQKFFMNLK
jgi:hypothetical protein